MATGSQASLKPGDEYVQDVYLTTEDLNFDVQIMSRKDIMTLGMGPINKFRAENWPVLLNGIQYISTLVTLGSMMMISIGLNDLLTAYVYIHSSQTLYWGCMEVKVGNGLVDAVKPSTDLSKRLAWIWIASGLWGGILPLCAGFLMNCSSNLLSKGRTNDGTYFGTIFYNANFPARDPPGVKIFRLLAMLDLVVVFVLSVINAVMSKECDQPRYPQPKFLFPVIVAVLSVVIFLLLFFSTKVKDKNLSRDENLHVGHTHILVRKFPVSADSPGERFDPPVLVGHGPPVVAPVAWGRNLPAPIIA